MAPRVYADAAAFAAYFPGKTTPANLDTLLRQASRLVDQLLLGRVYAVDTITAMPTDADDTQALSDATCAIAGELDATKALDAGGTTTWDQVKIGSVALGGRREGAAAAGIVDGFPIPAAAIVALSDVGRMVVGSAPAYVRPLDRVTR